jgi:hypothetical protein
MALLRNCPDHTRTRHTPQPPPRQPAATSRLQRRSNAANSDVPSGTSTHSGGAASFLMQTTGHTSHLLILKYCF